MFCTYKIAIQKISQAQRKSDLVGCNAAIEPSGKVGLARRPADVPISAQSSLAKRIGRPDTSIVSPSRTWVTRPTTEPEGVAELDGAPFQASPPRSVVTLAAVSTEAVEPMSDRANWKATARTVATATSDRPMAGAEIRRLRFRIIFRHCRWVGVDRARRFIMLKSFTGLWRFFGQALTFAQWLWRPCVAGPYRSNSGWPPT